MINFENTSVYGWEAAIRGMRNSYNSWANSDSYETHIENQETLNTAPFAFFIGENDLELMKQLVKAGSSHSKFMRMITVNCDITAPLYWWKEFDTYKVGTVRNSCSTMHKIQDKEFTLEDFSIEHLNNISINDMKSTIDMLNFWREQYNVSTNNENKKNQWWQMIQLLPSSYNQRATVQLNYAVLRNMYHSRKNHKLDEWSHGFTEWVESLPYSELITEVYYADENKRMKEQIEQLVKKYE